jgi:hypothetical protein
MAAFDDYLQGAPDPGPSVDELTVTAAPKAPPQDLGLQSQPVLDPGPLTTGLPGPVDPGAPQTASPPGLNYNNSGDASAVSNALTGEPALRGGMANPGLYGLLPSGLQHGTLRNMLGALGDAFLVGSGRQAQYEPRMQRQEIGQAMAGYDPNNPQAAQAAIQRIAATGAAGSPEMADQLQKNYNDTQLRRATMQNTQMYHQQTIQARNDNLFNRMNSVAQADLAQAQTPEDYQARLSRWDQRVKAIDPNTDASTQFGVPDKYTPGALGATSGMTAQQISQHGDRQSQQQTSMRNTDVNAASRVKAAGIGAGSRNYNTDETNNRPTSANILQGLIAKQNSGQQLTPAEQATFDHMTAVAKKGRTLPPGLTTPGGKPAPTAADRAYVQAHPETKGAFVAHFGVNP